MDITRNGLAIQRGRSLARGFLYLGVSRWFVADKISEKLIVSRFFETQG
jgi:hypothetical protein